MKRMFSLFLGLSVVSLGLFAQPDAGSIQKAPKITFTELSHNFGTIPQGIPVTHVFTFVNDGNEPLIIQDVQRTCGCTTPDWTKSPILPGQKGTVTATYNAANAGHFKKTVTVISNAENARFELFLEGDVAPNVTPIVPENGDNMMVKPGN